MAGNDWIRCVRTAVLVVAAACLLPVPAGAEEALPEITVTARKREESLQEVPLSISVLDADAIQERNIDTVYDVATFTPGFNFSPNTVGRRLDAPSIRGQFTPLANYGSEGNVGFYVDGVFVSGTAGGLTTDNVERIEVIKGPQVAQFGRAAFAGAVNYITRRPTEDQQGGLDLKAGEDREYKAAGWLSGPLIEDKLLYMVSAGYETIDGEWNNSLIPCQSGQNPATDNCTRIIRGGGTWPTGQPPSTVNNDFTELGGQSGWNVTGKLTWNVRDNLTINTKAEHSETDDQHYASLLQTNLNCYLPGVDDDEGAGNTAVFSPGWYCGELKPGGLLNQMNIDDLRQGATSTYGTAQPAPFIGQQTQTDRFLGEAILDLESWSLVGRATYNDQRLESYRDLDQAPALGPIWANVFDAGEKQYWKDKSFEVRATSDQGEALRGTVGAYYFDARNKGYQREYTGFCGRTEYGLPYIDGSKSWSLNSTKKNQSFFAGGDYDLTSTVTLSVETRYSKDTPEQKASNGVDAKKNYYSFTPRVTLTWKPEDDVMLYGLVAEGNKPGGFFYGYFDAPVIRSETERALENGKAVIKEEKAWTYEVGAKTQWLERRVTANVSAYYIDWTNQAINEVDYINWYCPDTDTAAAIQNNFIRNAGKSQVIGAELELAYAATENLDLSLAYSLIETELKEYNSLSLAQLTSDDPVVRQNGVSVAGNEAPRVPKNSLAASASYHRPLGEAGAQWFLRTDYIYNSKTWLDAENLAYVGELNLLNGRIGIETASWTAALYVDNITDTDTPLLASEFPNFAQFPQPPPPPPDSGLPNYQTLPSAFHLVPRRGRTAGVNLQFRF